MGEKRDREIDRETERQRERQRDRQGQTDTEKRVVGTFGQSVA